MAADLRFVRDLAKSIVGLLFVIPFACYLFLAVCTAATVAATSRTGQILSWHMHAGMHLLGARLAFVDQRKFKRYPEPTSCHVMMTD